MHNLLTDFSASIRDINWSNNIVSWWSDDDTDQLPGSIIPPRGASSVTINSWFFGDPFFAEQQLFLNFEESSTTFAAGTWDAFAIPPGGGDPTLGAGNFEITIADLTEPSVPQLPNPNITVPEPSSLVGLFCALGFLCYAQKSEL